VALPLLPNKNRKQRKEMEKKLYLKPETEVIDFIFENELLAGTVSYEGGEDEIIIPEPSVPDPHKPIGF
jgi:hypothetical protein